MQSDIMPPGSNQQSFSALHAFISASQPLGFWGQLYWLHTGPGGPGGGGGRGSGTAGIKTPIFPWTAPFIDRLKAAGISPSIEKVNCT